MDADVEGRCPDEGDDMTVELDAPECPDEPNEPVDDALVDRAIRHWHTTMGHPSNRAMARAVRLTSGSEKAIRACLRFLCTICRRLRQPAPIPASSLRQYKQLGDCIAVDLFELADPKGLFLNCVGMASRYQLVAVITSKRPAEVLATLMRVWCSWAGVTRRLLSDMGGEFRREFAEELEAMDVELDTAAALSPTQNSIAERAGGSWIVHAWALADEYLLCGG